MEAVDVLAAGAVGLLAGASSGLLGIGGGVLFVPALVLFLDQTQLEAEATSLLAVVVVALVGAVRQSGYDNVRPREGILVGALSIGGVIAGALIANAVPQGALELMFAAVLLYFAAQLGRRALRPSPG